MNNAAALTTVLVTPTSALHGSPGEQADLERARDLHLARSVDARESISLRELDRVSLLDRLDAKYLLNQRQAEEFLARLDHHYRVLEIEGERVHGYRTLYFDTSDFALYNAHHVGRPNRYKVRSRQYLESGLAFFEVKRKDRLGRTRKSRMSTGDLVVDPGACELRFLQEYAPGEVSGLVPAVHNTFSRVTLANINGGEGVTLDGNLAFAAEGNVAILPGLVVVEVKTGGSVHRSPAAQALRAMNIRPTAFSKYCIGVALLRRDQKHNRFKPQLLRVNRLIGGAP